MKIRNYKNRDFSNQFNHLTLMDILKVRKQNIKENTIIRTNPIKFNSLEENFIPRIMEQETIKPDRFVWHVASYRNHFNNDLNRFSIAKEGLKCDHSKCKVVFANNALISLAEFYPLIFDFCIFPESNAPLIKLIKQDMEEPLLLCDYWRIDTHAFNARWYIDPNMATEQLVKAAGNYICTNVDIPSHALKLYKITLAIFREIISINQETGTTIIPVSLLSPDERVNNWVNRNKRAA